MIAVPVDTPVRCPEPLVIAAMAEEEELQLPPTVVSLSVSDAPAQTPDGPDIAAGATGTVTEVKIEPHDVV